LEVASFLFAMRMLQTIIQIAQAPFSSVQPLMARLMAAGNTEALGKLIRQRMGYTLALTAAGVGFGSVAIPLLLQLIGAKIDFIPIDAWLLLGGLTLILRFDVLCCAVSATGNQMVYYWDMAAAAVISAVALLLLGNSWSIYTPIITSTIPLVLILNFRPIRQARLILNKHEVQNL
jgi:O-antigen/teichoic acid export membrane protein